MKLAYAPPTRTRQSIRWALYTLIPFSGFYTVKLGLSPVYLTFSLAIFALIASMHSGIRVRKEASSLLLCVLLLAYITAMQAFVWKYDSALPSASINLAFSLLYFIATTTVLENSSRNHALRASELAIALSIVLLTLELAYRLTHPTEPADWPEMRDDLFWYLYKTSSFMYPDSNSVGLFVACLLAFCIGLPRGDARRFRKYLVPLAVLLVGSLSRSAILATAFVFFHHYASKTRFKHILLPAAAIGGIVLIFFVAKTDDSFLSKFWIAELVAKYLETIDLWTLMTGVGPGNAERVLGVGAHLLPFILLIEIGVGGTLLVIALWLCIWKQAGKNGTPIFLVMLLNGLSFSTFAIPWFYSMVAVLIYFSRVSSSARLSPDSRL